MTDQREYERAYQQVEGIIDVWLEYDETGDASLFEANDVFTPDVMHNPAGEPPVVGKEQVLEYLEELDPTALEWTIAVDNVSVGRDLVIARTTYRGTKRTEAGDEHAISRGTSIDAFRWQTEGTLKQILSAPNPDG